MNTANDPKGRGARIDPHNRFHKLSYEVEEEYLEYCRLNEELPASNRTQYIPVHPKTIINRVDSPDVGFNWSINPYQGCEHGCVYCYARNTHEYWGYSAGVEFESKILVKTNASELLWQALAKPSWKPETIVLSGNTDCYQPAEAKFRITRSLLECLLECRHPVGLITKNSLILRDLDLLSELARQDLVKVTLSITTLNEDLRRTMEPRTASVANRLKAVEELSRAGVPVNVNFAPIVPGLNSHELFDLAEAVAGRGARSASYILVRLNGQIGDIFEDWVRKEFPEAADKVLNIVRETHGGTLNESRWKVRMKGEGHYADQISGSFKLACKKFGLDQRLSTPVNTTLFRRPSKGAQLSMW